ncbi:low molecular weight protein-tyrosine-phosphatase [Dokdonella fugitiva]|jgi:protein-tyrosine phosphatase|uniref:protein-tyrosine-phosphatase n=1 Tax=Dokdonella fugitiva TaxID=328517 RepID=A0A4R2I7Y7_9GAMM|nr:low molecular weight protein-tyrosine-phosphatase [Dokdonella fugitiva]MBA8883110.1 protein-tyrosine phosphatase [Dokdonella fugitiva]TCO40444.1 protein-tyrosine phosphatase [Dokdonella fugitiva]
MDNQEKQRILFICMGNICRSPTVEGIARAEFARAGLDIEVDSAGTEDYHVGEPPDERAIRAAAAHGYDIAGLRARQVTSADFERFDLVFAMDRMNLLALQRFHRGLGVEPALFLGDTELPDPYYGTARDFDRVVELSRKGVDVLIRRLRPPKARRA